MADRNDGDFMREAVEVARRAQAQPGCTAVGALVVLNGTIIASACNEVELRGDPTAHAEILAIRRACEAISDVQLRGATLYSTLQPCGMCTMGAIWSKLSRIVYGAGRNDVHRMYFEDRHLDCADFVRDAFRGDLTVSGGVAVKECAALYPSPHAEIPPSEQANL